MNEIKYKCRCCGSILPEEELLLYPNMPKSAQFFPDASTVAEEKGVDIILFQCENCGLIQAIGEPVPYYKDVIRATGVSDSMRLFREKQFSQWVKANNLMGKKILEVGCGKGEYMDYMEPANVKVTGLEHLRESVEEGNKAGHKIYNGFIESYNYEIPEAPYDGFYIMNFLEHIPKPADFLQGIAHNLSDFGVGIVEVPNVNMILEKKLYSEFIQDHLMYFTKDSLRLLLELNGFEVLSCDEIWYNYIISACVRKRRKMDVSGFAIQKKKVQREIDAYIAKKETEKKHIAVWGAGHQALANLSMLNIAENIDLVIDSAEFKQNKYTPATHIPIVGPDILETGTIQAVIVMAAGFSDEVKDIMKKKYPAVECVVLREDRLEIE